MVRNWDCFDHLIRISLFFFSFKYFLGDLRRLKKLLLFFIIKIDGHHLFSDRTVKLEWLSLNMLILKDKWLYFLILLIFHLFWAWTRSNWLFFILDRILIIVNLLWNIRRSRKHTLFSRFLQLFCQRASLLMVGCALFSDSQSTCVTPIKKAIFLLNRSESIDSTQALCFMSN